MQKSREQAARPFGTARTTDFDVTEDTYRLEPHGNGTRFTFDHTGFTGVGGFVTSRLLSSVRKKMLGVGLPAVLDDLDDEGKLRPGSRLADRRGRHGT